MSEFHELDRKIAVLQTELICAKDAVIKQAAEYERRLTELNHSHRQQVERNAHYVSREAWDLRNKELDSRLLNIDRWRWMSVGAASAIGGILGALIQRLM